MIFTLAYLNYAAGPGIEYSVWVMFGVMFMDMMMMSVLSSSIARAVGYDQ